MSWIHLNQPSEFEALASDFSKPIVIFKHSTRCGVSSSALKMFQPDVENIAQSAQLCMVDVIKSRELSNYLAHKTEIRHESPQVLVINNGKVVYNASHHFIDSKEVLSLISST